MIISATRIRTTSGKSNIHKHLRRDPPQTATRAIGALEAIRLALPLMHIEDATRRATKREATNDLIEKEASK